MKREKGGQTGFCRRHRYGGLPYSPQKKTEVGRPKTEEQKKSKVVATLKQAKRS